MRTAVHAKAALWHIALSTSMLSDIMALRNAFDAMIGKLTVSYCNALDYARCTHVVINTEM